MPKKRREEDDCLPVAIERGFFEQNIRDLVSNVLTFIVRVFSYGLLAVMLIGLVIYGGNYIATTIDIYRQELALAVERRNVGSEYVSQRHCTDMDKRFVHEKHGLKDCTLAQKYADSDPNQQAIERSWHATSLFKVYQKIRKALFLVYGIYEFVVLVLVALSMKLLFDWGSYMVRPQQKIVLAYPDK